MQWNILALESSSRIITAALKSGKEYREILVDAGFRHVETLMPSAAALLELAGLTPSDINLVVCSAGPGSFTGLRIGMAAAKGIARGAACAIKAVPTLPLLAKGREHWPGIVVPLMDARKSRVYTAAFQGGERIADDCDIAFPRFLESLPPNQEILVTGPDARIAEGERNVTVDPLFDSSRGRQMMDMAISLYEKEGGDPSDLGPLYLRLSEAEEKLQNRRDWT